MLPGTPGDGVAWVRLSYGRGNAGDPPAGGRIVLPGWPDSDNICLSYPYPWLFSSGDFFDDPDSASRFAVGSAT